MLTAGRPTPTRSPPPRCDVAVVGAGIVGLAVARELALRHGARRICVLEREERIATHQSSHNSGVVHAGVYYQPGSLKARLCVEGARQLYAYCEQREIPHRRAGKLIVATATAQLTALDALQRRAVANGVSDVRRIGPAQMAEIEPHVRGLAALHSPHTGVVDFAAVAAALAEDLRRAGGELVLGCEVVGVRSAARALRLEHRRGTLQAGCAVFCAGAWSDRLARAAGADPDPRIVPFRGAYLRLVPARRELVRSLIYPLADPALPFLGVHLTRTIAGEVLLGPTALIAGARDAYSLRRVRAVDVAQTLAWPGSWRLGRRWWRTGLRELEHALLPRTLVREAAGLIAGLTSDDVRPAWAGIRAQAVARDGRLLDDFAFSRTPRALHVRNAPSPAATSCLTIATLIAERAEWALGLGSSAGVRFP